MVFRFTLTNEDKGTLILSRDPSGWKDIEVILMRGLEYHGTFYETLVQLEFECGSGKEYIDEIYDEFGVDAVINIKIEINCNSLTGITSANDYSDDYSDDYGSYINDGPDAVVFETLFEGTLDLSKYNKDTKRTYVDLLQSDFIQKVLNRFETKIELTSNTSIDNIALDPITNFPSDVTLHSRELLLTSSWENVDDSDSMFISFPLDVVNIEVPLIKVSDDIGGAKDATSPYVFSSLSSGSPRGTENTSPFFTNETTEAISVNVNLNIAGTLSVRNEITSLVDYHLYLQIGGIEFAYSPPPLSIQDILDINLTGGVQLDIAVNASYSSLVSLPAGESMFLTFGVADVEGNVSDPSLFEFISFIPTTFELSLTQESIIDSSTSKIFLIHETGAAIAQRITSQEDAFRSELLGRKNSAPNSYDENGCGSFNGMLNGKHVRGFPISEAPFFMSMNEYFKTVNSIYNTGLGFEKINDQYVIRIEGKEYFYDTEVILQCPNAIEVKTSVAKEYYISSILLGFDKWEVENINGLDEFNTKRNYDNGIRSINNKVDAISPSVASMYSIEFARRQGVSTVDYKYDNDTFIICLNRSTNPSGIPTGLGTCEKNENYGTISNLRSPETAYNLRISPARNLLRHMNIISSSIIKYVGRAVKFVYGEGNFIVETQTVGETCPESFDNETLSESQDVTVSESGASPIWIPEYIDFEYPLSFSDYLNIKNNTFKCIEVSNTDGNFVKGFIIRIGYKPVGGKATFRLLRAYSA